MRRPISTRPTTALNKRIHVSIGFKLRPLSYKPLAELEYKCVRACRKAVAKVPAKDEIRKPMSERRPKSEIRTDARWLVFRTSGFGMVLTFAIALARNAPRSNALSNLPSH